MAAVEVIGKGEDVVVRYHQKLVICLLPRKRKNYRL